MSKGPRWITEAEAAPFELIQLVPITLTDDQIKALPSSRAIIIPATEVLDYSGFPTEIPLIVTATAFLDASGGAYTNITAGGSIALVYGSDWSSTAATGISMGVADGQLTLGVASLDNQARKSNIVFNPLPSLFFSNGLQDNALAITADNSDGDFTGGDPSNIMTVDILYWIKTL